MNLRAIISDVEKRKTICKGLGDIVKSYKPDLIAATASAGVPWGTWVADRMELPLTIIGGETPIDEDVSDYARAVVIEDLVSTGASSLFAACLLKKNGSDIAGCASIFTYGFTEAQNAFKENEIELRSLVTFTEAVSKAKQMGFLSDNEAQKAMIWLSSPKRWMI